MDVAKIIARSQAERGVRVSPSDEMLVIGDLISAAIAEQLPPAITAALSGVDFATTMKDVRKILVRLQPARALPIRTQWWIEAWAWVASFLLLAAIIMILTTYRVWIF